MKRRFTILESNPVIAEDICEILKDMFGSVEIEVAQTFAEALAVLETTLAPATTTILHAVEQELRDPELTAALAKTRTKTIAIHAPLSGVPTDWVFLPPPFTTDALRAALLRAGA